VPLRNRVTPFGELIADPARGLVYGNRGCLHDDVGIVRRRFAGKRWIACRLRFRGWHRSPLVQPGRFTELFFLDEATAFAAGHRPCALCRRDDYTRFAVAMRDLYPTRSAPTRSIPDCTTSVSIRSDGGSDSMTHRSTPCPTGCWSWSPANPGWSQATDCFDGRREVTPGLAVDHIAGQLR
jgi:hypothetical protein